MFEELVREILRNRIELNNEKSLKLKLYWDILLTYKDKTHLFSKKNPEEELKRQFMDIILLNVFLPDYRELIDAGAGAGFVGVILSILNPDRKFLLVERSRKKADFLELARIKLGISNVVILQKDINELMFNADIVVSKASCMRELLERNLVRIVRVGGILVHFSKVPLSSPYRNYPFKNIFRDGMSYLSVLERVI